jgi:hypothetical protein
MDRGQDEAIQDPKCGTPLGDKIQNRDGAGRCAAVGRVRGAAGHTYAGGSDAHCNCDGRAHGGDYPYRGYCSFDNTYANRGINPYRGECPPVRHSNSNRVPFG